MTRLSHFERLALGRSAFDDPLTDENGSFIVSQHAHEFDAPGYAQQFNERGRPVNEQSTRSERHLRRAQNEILEVVGVVRSRHELERQRSQAQNIPEEELLDLVRHENSIGSLMRMLFTMPMDLSVWWMVSHRYRLITFNYLSYPGTVPALTRECKSVGPAALFGSGLLYSLAANETQILRSKIVPVLHYSGSQDQAYEAAPTSSVESMVYDYLKDATFFIFQWPLRTFSTLQQLHLVPFSASLSGTQFLDFLISPAMLPVYPTPQSTFKDFIWLFSAIGTSPMIQSYFAEQLRESLQSSIRFLLLHWKAPCGYPDPVSVEAWDLDEIGFNAIPSKALSARSSGQRLTTSERFDVAFPLVARVARYFGLRKDAIWNVCDGPDFLQWYEDISINNARNGSSASVEDTRREEREVAFLQNSDQEEAGLHTAATETDDMSTATPEMQDLFEFQSRNVPPQEQSSSRSPQSSIQQPVNASLDPDEPFSLDRMPLAVPESDVLESFDFDSFLNLDPLDPAEAETTAIGLPSPSTPVPGLSRAASLSQMQDGSHPRLPVAPRPVRRPTEVDEQISAFVAAVRQTRHYDGPSHHHSASPNATRFKEKPKAHRYTSLSLFSEDAFAHYGSIFITSIIMLPFDIYYTRRLARAFLSTEHGADWSVSLPVGARSVSKSLGSGALLWLSDIAFTFAIEGVARTVMWQIGTRISLHIGKKYFLWGKA